MSLDHIPSGPPQISERATKLLDDCADASFECGEWNADQGEPYERQYEAASKARDAIVEYIGALEAQRAELENLWVDVGHIIAAFKAKDWVAIGSVIRSLPARSGYL